MEDSQAFVSREADDSQVDDSGMRRSLDERTVEPEAHLEADADMNLAENVEHAFRTVVDAAGAPQEGEKPLASSDAARRYSAVEMIPGDVSVDQDWNEEDDAPED